MNRILHSLNRRGVFRLGFACLLHAAGAMLILPVAHAGQEDTSPSTNVAMRYPSGSIQSDDMADAAIADAAKERAEVQARYAAEEQACQSRFFATSCIDEAKERRRKALATVRAVELEADTFKRKARVAERDKALADRQAQEVRKQEEAERQKMAAPDGENMAKTPQASKAPELPRKGPASDNRTAKHEARLKQIRAKEAAEAKMREENVAAYKRKVEEAKEHQKEVELKKAEKEQKRKGRQDTQAGQQQPGQQQSGQQ